MELHFTKMEGIGNDYIYVDGIHQEVPMDAEFISRISNRHFGIGGDGMIVILKSDQYDFKMRMFNLDGSEGMMCGNGIRCFAKFCYDHHLTDKKVLNIETKAGLRIVELIFDGDEVVGAKVDMQEPILNCKDIPVIFDQEKMINETRKILHDENLRITATTVRVPVLNSHSESINVELNNPFELKDIFTLFENTPGLTLYDNVNELKYPTPLEISGKDDVYIGRIRRDFSVDNGLNLWVVADNIRKGAALNAVQIAEVLINNNWL